MKNAVTYLLDSEHLYEWEPLLYKYFKDITVGFTSYYCYELSEGRVAMKKLCSVTEDDIETKVLVENAEATRVAVLEKLVGLPPDACLAEIVNTKPRFVKMKVKSISEKRLNSIKKKYPVIPPQHLWYYPEGDQYAGDARYAAKQDDVVLIDMPSLVKPKKKAGRPKLVKKSANTPSILSFFKAFPSLNLSQLVSKFILR